MECEFCKQIFKTKYTLKSHLINNKACLKLRGLSLESKFNCIACKFVFTNNINLNIHLESCKKYIILNIEKEYKENYIEKKELKENQELLQEQYDQKIKEKEKKYEQDLKEQQQKYEEKLQTQQNEYKQQLKEIQIKYEEKIEEKTQLLIEKLERLAEKSIDKPTTINNNNIKNYFSNTQYIEDINQNDLKKKLYSSLTEYHYMHGQKGIAIVCTEEIIKKTKDKKPIMICTDINRKNYKHTDKNGNVKTDHQARNFIEKVSKPIKEVSKEIYESIISNIETEKDQLGDEDFDEKDKIRTREFNVMNKLIEINNFDDPKYNSEFMSELAILNKS